MVNSPKYGNHTFQNATSMDCPYLAAWIHVYPVHVASPQNDPMACYYRFAQGVFHRLQQYFGANYAFKSHHDHRKYPSIYQFVILSTLNKFA